MTRRLQLVPDHWTEYDLERESLDNSEPPEHEHVYEQQYVCSCGEFQVDA